VASLLTLYVMMLVWAKGFQRDRADAPEGNVALARPAPLSDITDEVEFSSRQDVGRVPFGMVGATALLVIASTSITFLAGPISGVTSRAAESAQDTSIYQYAVLGENADNPTRHLDQKDRYEGGADSYKERSHLLPDPGPAHDPESGDKEKPSSDAPAKSEAPESPTPVKKEARDD